MRTTIEIDNDKLVKLKKMAAERGERGFSGLIDEALERYLAAAGDPEAARRARQAAAVRAAAGSITEEQAEVLFESVRESRSNWRRS